MKKYVLMVSHDLGCHYHPEYRTDDRNDPELQRRMTEAADDRLRFYVEGAPEVVSPLHQQAIRAIGGVGFATRTIEEKVERLTQAWNR